MLLRSGKHLFDHGSFNLRLGEGCVLQGVDLAEFGILWEFVHGASPAWDASFRFLRSGDVALDVGANIGLWALRAAARVGESGEVHAFEPDAEVAMRLRGYARQNRLEITVVEEAVSDHSGSISFYPGPAQNSSKASTTPRPDVTGEPMEVSAVTLDDYCALRRLDELALIKIDVEGGEEHVLRGAQRTLGGASAPAVLFESCEELAARAGSSAKVVKEILTDSGYRLVRIDEGGRLRDVGTATIDGQVDLLALKSHHAERLQIQPAAR